MYTTMYQHFSFDPATASTEIPSLSNGKVALINVISSESSSLSKEPSSSPSVIKVDSVKPLGLTGPPPPPYLDAPHSFTLSEVKHWRRHFLVVLLPFLPWGIPVHLLLRSRPRRISSTRTWLKFLCPLNSPLTSILTLIQVLLTLFFNFIFLYFAFSVFNMLIIKGILHVSLLSDLASVLKILVLIIPLNLIWIKGHSLHRLFVSFDRLVSEFLLLDPFNKNEDLVKPSYWVKLILIYLAIVLIFALSWISVYYSPPPKGFWPYYYTDPPYDQVMKHGIYSMNIFTALIFPLYCSFCWAIHHQLLLLRKYLNFLMKSKIPAAYVHLDNIKYFYMRIADQVVCVNRVFSVYLTLVAIGAGLFLYSDFEKVSGKLLETIIGFTTASIVPLLKGQKSSGDSETLSENENDLKELNSPYKVRLIIADLFGLLLYAGIAGLSYWQAVKTNDEIRSLHIWLNDFVTEPQSRLRSDLHGAVNLLKCYIHVRLEQEVPALLNITALSLLPIPFLKRRLISYRVIH